MDWKNEFKASIDRQPVNEGFFGDAKNLVFGKSRGEKEEDIRSAKAKASLGGVHPADTPAAPPVDRFATIKGYKIPDEHHHLKEHIRDSIMMARHADAKGAESTVEEYHSGYNGDYQYSGSHDNETLARSLGASLLKAHAGLPAFDDHEDSFLHNVNLNDEGKLEAHYKSNDRYMKTRHVQPLE